MKSRKILLLLILSVFLLTLAACAGEVGPQGPAGPAGQAGQTGQTGQPGTPGKDGEDGKDGADGEAGKDGLSAFDIYKEAYPGYEGTEAEWFSELMSGKLSMTVIVNYKNNAREYKTFMKGELLPESPYSVNWFLDNKYTKAAEGTAVLKDLELYIDLAYVGTPISAPTLKITALDAGLKKIVAGGVDYFLHDDFKLSNADGLLLAETAANAFLDGGFIATAVLMDVSVVDGKVVSARYASSDTLLKTSNKKIVDSVNVGPNTIVVERTSNVAAVLGALTSDHPQTRVMLDAADKPVAAGDLKANFKVKVTAENGVSATYDLVYKDLIGNTAITVGVDGNKKTLDTEGRILNIDNVLLVKRGSSITLRHGTTNDYVDGKLTKEDANNADFVPVFTYVNSQGVALGANTAFSEGDQIVVTFPGYSIPSMNYYVKIEKETDASLVLVQNPATIVSVTESVITLKWDASVLLIQPDVVQGLKTYKLEYNERTATDTKDKWEDYDNNAPANHPTTFYNQGDDNNIAKFRLTVTAQDGTTKKVYTFALENSTSKVVQVKAGNAHLAQIAGNVITVQYNTTAAQLIAVLESTDKSTLALQVKNSEGTVKLDRLFDNDTLFVNSHKPGTPAEYKIEVGNILTSFALTLKGETVVLDALNNVEPQILTQTVTNVFNLQYAPTQRQHIIADIDLAQFGQTAEIFVKNAAMEVVAGKTGNAGSLNLAAGETLWINIYAQNHTTAAPNFQEYQLVIKGLSANAVPTVKAPVKYGTAVAADINVNMTYVDQNGNNTNTTIANLISDLDLESNYQRIIGVFTLDNVNNVYNRATQFAPTSFLSSLLPVGNNPAIDYYLGVAAQDYVAAPAAGIISYYKINVVRKTETGLLVSSEPKVITNGAEQLVVGGAQINVLPESAINVKTTVQIILADINLKTHVQTARAVMWSVAENKDVPFVAEPINDTDNTHGLKGLKIEITAQDGTTMAYPINVLVKSADTGVKEVAQQKVINNVGADVTVVYGTTVQALLAAIEPAKFFQTAQVLNNAGTVKTNQTVFTNDILRIKAQDGTVLDYTIIVSPQDPVVGPTTVIATGKASVEGLVITLTDDAMTVTDFLKLLSVTGDTVAGPNATLTVEASSGAAPAPGDDVKDGDILVVRPVNGAGDGSDDVVYRIRINK